MESVASILDFLEDPTVIECEDYVVCRKCKVPLVKYLTLSYPEEEVIVVWRCPKCRGSVQEV